MWLQSWPVLLSRSCDTRACLQHVEVAGPQPLLHVSKGVTFDFAPPGGASVGAGTAAAQMHTPAQPSSGSDPAAGHTAAPVRASGDDVLHSVTAEAVCLIPLVPDLVKQLLPDEGVLHMDVPSQVVQAAHEDAALAILLPELHKHMQQHARPDYRTQHGIPGRIPTKAELLASGRPDLAAMYGMVTNKHVRRRRECG